MSLPSSFRTGVRLMARQPGLTAVAVIALTLGIGLTTVMFSIIEGAFLRGLPFEGSDRIAAVTRVDTSDPRANRMNISPHDFADYRKAQQAFEVFGAFYEGTVNVSGSEGRPELRLKRGDGEFVTPIGRLRPGVTFEAAEAEFAGLAKRQAQLYPDTNKGMTAHVMPYIDRFFGPDVYSILYTMLGAVFGVMLIACANVANLILKDEARGSSSLRMGRMSRALVVAEIAVSCGLLVASGQSIKSIINLKTTDYGFATDNVFTARIGLFEADYPDEAARGRFFTDVLDRMRTIPGAQAASISSSLPSAGSEMLPVAAEGATYATNQDHPRVPRASVTPGFFDTFDRRILGGRDFTDADEVDAPPVAIVNESLAARLFKGEDPVGRRIRPNPNDEASPWVTIVGVVPDMYMGGLQSDLQAGFYRPLLQDPPRFASLAVRTASAPMTLTSAVRDQVNALDPDLPLYWVRTRGTGVISAGSIPEMTPVPFFPHVALLDRIRRRSAHHGRHARP
jgi:hypothetical protein